MGSLFGIIRKYKFFVFSIAFVLIDITLQLGGFRNMALAIALGVIAFALLVIGILGFTSPKATQKIGGLGKTPMKLWPKRKANHALLTMLEEQGVLPSQPNVPKLAHAELYITYHKHEFGVAGEGKYTGLSVDNGTPILSVEAEFRPTGPMRIEVVELCLVGKRISSLNCEVQESSDRLWFTPSNIFNVSRISLGKHDAELVALANGEWWRSHPFTIAFPEVNP